MTGFRPGNYSVHFMEHMDALKPTCPSRWFDNLQWLCRMISKAQHFQLPDDGRLIKLEDMPDEMPQFLRPPYPVTVIEYQSKMGSDPTDPLSSIESSRRMVVAIDANERDFAPYPVVITQGEQGEFTNGVWLVPAIYNDAQKLWVPPPAMFFLSYDRPVILGGDQFPEQLAKLGIDHAEGMKGLPMDMAGLAVEIFTGETGCDLETLKHFTGCVAADAQAELFAYQQLCVVLACANVSTEREAASPKLNRARAKSHKRAMFDYHVLTIPGGGGDGSGADSGRVIRTHLRRGHIRRIKPGKIVWINATLVKGGAAGFVSKSYGVREPE